MKTKTLQRTELAKKDSAMRNRGRNKHADRLTEVAGCSHRRTGTVRGRRFAHCNATAKGGGSQRYVTRGSRNRGPASNLNNTCISLGACCSQRVLTPQVSNKGVSEGGGDLFNKESMVNWGVAYTWEDSQGSESRL